MLTLCLACSTKEQNNVTAGDNPAVTFTDSIVLVFTGDVMLDRGVRRLIEQHDVKWLFCQEESRFNEADAVIINLECPLADTLAPLTKKYIFHADTQWANGLHEAGITHAALANNHTNDQGFQGLRSTVNALREAGLTPIGIGRDEEERMKPTVIEKGGLRVALFNAVLFTLENWISTSKERHWLPNQVDARRLAQAIKTYKQEHPETRIVAIVHWGQEYETTPNLQQQQQARMLISAGADAIIGHHPHVIQPMQQVLGKPVYFSLGNYIFDHRSSPDSAVVRLVIE